MDSTSPVKLQRPLPARPFPGLRSFADDERIIFFGRDRQIRQMVERLGVGRFLCITGPSGCGKSSLARTGLFSGLRAGYLEEAGSNWLFVDMHPGNDPVGALGEALAQAICPELNRARSGDEQISEIDLSDTFSECLRLGRRDGLREALELVEVTRDRPVLLLIDQFEEIFRISQRDPEGSREFIRAMLEAIQQGSGRQLYVAITIRADALDNCALYEGLAEAVNQGQFLTPALTRSELSDVIEGPVALYGGTVDTAFTAWLLNHMVYERDRLPLLQHVLRILWDDEAARIEEGKNETPQPHLTLDDFKRTFPSAIDDAAQRGDALRLALSSRLDRIYLDAPAELRPIIQRIFCSLVDMRSASRDIRRSVSVSELALITGTDPSTVCAAADLFRQPGGFYLSPGLGHRETLRSDDLISVTHECILRQWRRLRDEWLPEEERSIERLTSLVLTARDNSGASGSTLSEPNILIYDAWLRDSSVTRAWARQYLRPADISTVGASRTPEEAFDLAIEYLEFSRISMQASKQRESQRRTRNRVLLGSIPVLAVVAAAGGMYWQLSIEEAAAEQLALVASVATSSPVNGTYAAQADGDTVARSPPSASKELARLAVAAKNDTPKERQLNERVRELLRDAHASIAEAAEAKQADVVAVTTGKPDVDPVGPSPVGVPFVGMSLGERVAPCEDIQNVLPQPAASSEADAICRIPISLPAFADFELDSKAESYFIDGRDKLNAGKYVEARQDFILAKNSQANVPRLYRYLGWTYLGPKSGSEDVSTAWSCFDGAVRLSCQLKEDSERDAQLLWSYSNLSEALRRAGRPELSAAAMAQRGLLYRSGRAFEGDEIDSSATHLLRLVESYTLAGQRFGETEDCTVHEDKEYCTAARQYLDRAAAEAAKFIDLLKSRASDEDGLDSGSAGRLNTFAWLWATEPALGRRMSQVDNQSLHELMAIAVENYGDRRPSFWLTLGYLDCLRNELASATATRENWPERQFRDRVRVVDECIGTLQASTG